MLLRDHPKITQAQLFARNVEPIYVVNWPTQLLNITGIDGDIDDHQVLKHQILVTSRVTFHHLIPLIMIKC